MREPELLTLVEQSAVHEVWEAVLGAERVLVRRTTVSAGLEELSTLAAALRGRAEILEQEARGGKFRLIERRPPGRRLDDLHRTFLTPCPPDVACAFGLELIGALLESHEITIGLEAHGALDARSVFVADDGRLTISGFAFGRFALGLLGEPSRSDARAVREIVELMSPGLAGPLAALEDSPGPTLSLLQSILRSRARASSGAPALSAWLTGSSPLARLLDLSVGSPPSPTPRRQTARAAPREETLTEVATSGRFSPGAETWTSEGDTSNGPNSFDPPDHLAMKSWVGRTIDGYRLERKLGSGSFGDVYYGRDAARGVECAVKVLQSALVPALRARLLREAQAAIRVRHPNLIEIFDYGEADGVPYLLMEYVAGSNLKEILWREGPLDPPRVARLMRQLALSLSAIHGSGTVHRDIKPANILIRGDATGETLKVTDFGVARIESAELTRLTGVEALGTPLYMAPEQSTSPHDVGSAADLYSAGVILYEMIAGRPPFVARSLAELLADHASAAPLPPPDADGLGPIALTLLAKDPSARPSAEALVRLIEETAAFAPPSVTAPFPVRAAVEERPPASPVEVTTLTPIRGGALRAVGLAAGFLLITALVARLTVNAVAGKVPAIVTPAPSALPSSEPAPPLVPKAIVDTTSRAVSSEETKAPEPSPQLPKNEPRRGNGRTPTPTPAVVVRVTSALARRGLRRGDLELAPELARRVSDLERSARSGPEQERSLAALEEAIAKLSIDRRFLGGKLDRALRRLRGASDHLPSDHIEALEGSYIEAASKLQRATSDEELAVARQAIDKLEQDLQELR